MLKTWTDTHYKLENTDWLYIATHEEQGTASLICPGYARDGAGFSIHFTPAHIEILQNLLAVLQSAKDVPPEVSQPNPVGETDGNHWVELYPSAESTKKAEAKPSVENGYKYPIAPATHRHVIR